MRIDFIEIKNQTIQFSHKQLVLVNGPGFYRGQFFFSYYK